MEFLWKCLFWWINFYDVDVESADATWSTSRQNHPACTAPTAMKLTICHKMGISGSTRSWSVHLMTLNCCHGQLGQRARVTLFARTVSIIHHFGKPGSVQGISVTGWLHLLCSYLFIILLRVYLLGGYSPLSASHYFALIEIIHLPHQAYWCVQKMSKLLQLLVSSWPLWDVGSCASFLIILAHITGHQYCLAGYTSVHCIHVTFSTISWVRWKF